MLMRAHARTGDQRAVRTSCAAYVAAHADLGLEVEESLRSLHATLDGSAQR